MKRYAFVFLAVFAALLMVNTAWAVNRVEVKVTSEPINAGSTSEKAGAFSLEWDQTANMVRGDQITIDLPLNVTIAKEIDFIKLDESGNYAFKVRGAVGTQRVTIDVLGDVPDETPLVLQLFDQSTTNVFVDTDGDGFYGAYDGDGDDDAATAADNTLCIDVSQYTGEVVKASMDSKEDKFTFVPSDPQIAHIVTAQNFSLFKCKGQDDWGYVEIASADQEGFSQTCNFDYESTYGYCGYDQDRMSFTGGRIIIQVDNRDLPSDPMTLTLAINAAGVYWASRGVGLAAYETADDVCDNANAEDTTSYASTAYKSDGTTVVSSFDGLADCDVSSTDPQAKILKVSFTIPTGQKYLVIDLPKFAYDAVDVSDGEEVFVDVTLNKEPCGTIFSTTHKVAEFIDDCDVLSTESQRLLFPYFTQLGAGDAWWEGLVVTNLSSNAANCTVTIYEADGDMGTWTLDPIPGLGQVAYDLSTVLGDVTSSGTIGDSRCWIRVNCDQSVDGFAFIGDGTQAQGYLPRQYMD
jgi:hypothetical protein